MAIKLAKTGDTHKLSLRKSPSAGAVSIHCNLTWRPAEAPPAKSGFLGGLFGGGKPAKPEQEDLDLGCMWLDETGDKGVIQALGDGFGSKSQKPYIHLDKDDRSGASTDGENLFITRADAVKRVLIFAYIYQGSAFSKVNAKLTLKVSNGEVIEIELDAPSRDRSFCAAALVEVNGDQVSVRKENTYHRSHQDCDAAYGFGFQWTRGSK